MGDRLCRSELVRFTGQATPGGRGDEADVDSIVDRTSPLDLWPETGRRRPVADPEMVDIDRELD